VRLSRLALDAAVAPSPQASDCLKDSPSGRSAGVYAAPRRVRQSDEPIQSGARRSLQGPPSVIVWSTQSQWPQQATRSSQAAENRSVRTYARKRVECIECLSSKSTARLRRWLTAEPRQPGLSATAGALTQSAASPANGDIEVAGTCPARSTQPSGHEWRQHSASSSIVRARNRASASAERRQWPLAAGR